MQRWVLDKVGHFLHHTIVIDAGPYRANAVTTHSRNGVLHMDFYSALRSNFGELSTDDVTRVTNLL